MALTLQSPGVQINEVDLSLAAPGIPPTTILIPGFAAKGPSSEPITITSLSEWEQVFGLPTNAAERYFYQTANAVFQSPANVVAYRLPYGSAAGVDYSSQYSALVYPVIAAVSGTSATYNYISGGNQQQVAGVGYQWSTSTTGSAAFTNALPANYPSYSLYTTLCGLSTTILYQNSAIALANPGLSSNATTWSLSTTNNFIATTLSASTFTVTPTVSTTSLAINAGTYLFGAPTHIRLTQQQFLAIQNGTAFTWASASDAGNIGGTSAPVTTFTPTNLPALGNAGLIILNVSQNAINTRFEGNYIGLMDNTNLYPSTPFNDVNNIYTINSYASAVTPSNYITVPPQRLNFSLSAGVGYGPSNNISQVIESIPSFDISTPNFNDSIIVGLFKLRQSVFSPNTIALDYVLTENYFGSLDYYRQINNPTGGVPKSFFIGNIENTSNNIQLLINPNITQQYTTTWLNLSGNPNKNVRLLNNARQYPLPNDTITFVAGTSGLPTGAVSDTFATRTGVTSAQYASLVNALGTTDALYPLGDYSAQDLSVKTIGNVPTKVTNMLSYLEDPAIWPLSIVTEAGLGTIYANANGNPSTPGYFDDAIPYITGVGAAGYNNTFYSLTAQNPVTPAQIVTDYNAVAQQFINFASNVRKDHLFIADPLTNIFVNGQAPGVKTLTNPNNNFSLNIYWPLRNQFASFNNSYTAVYANVVQVYDNASQQPVWVPFSGFAAAAMAKTDSNFQPWFAPAGFTRGILTGVLDIGFSPKQKERDQLYTISLNPVAQFPNEGYVIYGQKTALKQPSAFDRINVRRLFLTLEVQTNAVCQFFVFEPNTLFTRTRLVNTITPIFDYAKNTQGVYDYLIVCDERNNTPAVIDQNELVVDIYLKPVRTAEFILVNFYATQTSANFNEIVA
jgi:Phage tail sheath protein subtilisin-like domain/Phage tail sheath C-terminal domain